MDVRLENVRDGKLLLAGEFELHPERTAASTARARRALPIGTREFGKLVDTSMLRPGDLLLSRELTPDRVSALISEVQVKGGYFDDNAQWSHAAMYIGDDQGVVEATFDGLATGGDVRLTSLDEYCNGASAMRFRRSKFVPHDRDGWRLGVRAMSRLTKPYSFAMIARTWFDVVVRDQGFWTKDKQPSITHAVVCSTLYADSLSSALNKLQRGAAPKSRRGEWHLRPGVAKRERRIRGRAERVAGDYLTRLTDWLASGIATG